MKPAPDSTLTADRSPPPSHGPGSGKDAWRDFALHALDANTGLAATIREQAEVIADMKAEIALLRRQIATRKPAGGREPITDEKVARIETALRTGETTRSIAKGLKVSPMTVSRVGKRMREREAANA